ncbi:hypothetical protein [Rhodobacter sp. SY28-1]|uniref:hypothetical protein n=1 Tax=Rhodobacter sp. SY28-1 TaxID=2562317 RepID=UPI0010C08257|nr:hypothetical protein [Rhodobacter sp. SY28-1]
MLNYVIALGIPLVLILLGALAKKLVRGTTWEARDFFLGVELSISAVSSALIYIFELSKSVTGQEKSISLGIFTATSLLLFFAVMAFHQDWEKKPQDIKGQRIWLGGVCNLIGVVLLSGFVLFVKGIQ